MHVPKWCTQLITFENYVNYHIFYQKFNTQIHKIKSPKVATMNNNRTIDFKKNLLSFTYHF